MSLKTFFMMASLLLVFACSGDKNNTEEEQNTEPATNQQTEQEPAAPETTSNGIPQATMAAGKTVYDTYCLVCHQADGNGVSGMNPPLTQTEWVVGDKERLIGVIINGLAEEIEIKGEFYNNVMAPHSFLTDQQIADVLTYVRNSFGNEASAITTEEVAEVRAAN